MICGDGLGLRRPVVDAIRDIVSAMILYQPPFTCMTSFVVDTEVTNDPKHIRHWLADRPLLHGAIQPYPSFLNYVFDIGIISNEGIRIRQQVNAALMEDGDEAFLFDMPSSRLKTVELL